MGQETLKQFGTTGALTITLDSLASSTGGKTVAYSNRVDNSSTKAEAIHIYVKIKTPASGKESVVVSTDAHGTSTYKVREDGHIYVWGFRADASSHHVSVDGAAATGTSGLSVRNAELLGTLTVPAPNAALVVQGAFRFDDPGPWWQIGIGHDLEADLAPVIEGKGEDPDTSEHAVYYITENPYLGADDAPG